MERDKEEKQRGKDREESHRRIGIREMERKRQIGKYREAGTKRLVKRQRGDT